MLKALGAEIIRTPNEYAFDHLYSHLGIAYTLNQKYENSHILDQYKNTGNPMAHYQETGKEIWEQCDGKIDYLFLGAGTGGTLTGITRYIKEKDPNVKVIAVDPYGSDLAYPAELNTPGPAGGYQVEGIGYDFIPRVLDRFCADEWVKIGDQEALTYARKLVGREGFLCGGSSGTAMASCVQYIKKHNIGKGKRCVILCPDNIRNYITKFINNDWMYEHGFISEKDCMEAHVPKLVPNNMWGQDKKVKDLNLHPACFLQDDMTCKSAIQLIKQNAYDQFPVKNSEG